MVATQSLQRLTMYGLIFPAKVGGTSATIADKRFVKFAATDGTADGYVLQAGQAEQILGVSSVPQATNFPVVQSGNLPPVIPAVTAASGEAIDVYTDKMPTVELGGTVNAGDYVMSDVDGRAILASGTVGQQVNIAGIAMASGALGGFIPVKLSPTKFVPVTA